MAPSWKSWSARRSADPGDEIENALAPSARAFRFHIRQPAVRILASSVNEIQEFLLNPLRDRTATSGADHDLVDAPYWCDFGGSASEEDLIRDVQHLARYRLFDHADAQLTRHGDD